MNPVFQRILNGENFKKHFIEFKTVDEMILWRTHDSPVTADLVRPQIVR